MVARASALTGLLCLSFLVGGIANATTLPAGTDASTRSGTALAAGLRPALYRAMAHDAGPAYAIGNNGCAKLPKQRLAACFGAEGVHFTGGGGDPLTLQLVAWGRDGALQAVSTTVPVIAGNQAGYARGAIDEWWRVLPVGFEQGFTIAQRPSGNGELTLALAANGKARAGDGVLAFGELRYGDLVVTDARGRIVPSSLAAPPGLTQPAPNPSTVTVPPGWPASAPRPIKTPPPAYPDTANYPLSQIAGSSVDVTVCFAITADGSVVDARIEHTNFPPPSRDLEVASQERRTDQAFEQAALDAIRQWKFTPPVHNGKVLDRFDACQVIHFR